MAVTCPLEDDMSAHFPALSGLTLPRNPKRNRLSLLHRLALMADVWRTRHVLADMDPRLLKDIGISRGEAQTEVNRAVWDFELRR
jgi:uncharacterized protein YjiS (DUF1127 family)